MTDFVIYDVFTDTVFGGNPLAIVPDATRLPEEQLQKIAREFNFSETTFVTPATHPDHDVRVRIFTPTQEILFAGHPTIGTAIALADMGIIGAKATIGLGIGPIPVTVDASHARFVTREPLTLWTGPPAEVVAASVSLSVDDIRTDRHPPIIASVGLPFAIAELTNLDALARCVASMDAFRAFQKDWPIDRHFDLFVYVRDGTHIRARMFAPLDGIPEDPATGSAGAALAAYLGGLEGVSARFEILQGVEMGRPSKITAEVNLSSEEPTSVAVSGKAVKVMEGRLTL